MSPANSTGHVSSGRRVFRPLSAYPHMSESDVPVWERFLRLHPDRFEFVDYDVRVGPGRGAVDSGHPGIDRMSRAITQLRLDAVGHRAGQATLIEVKPALSCSALGQLLVYSFHYSRDYPTSSAVKLLVVAGEDNADVSVVLDAYGIERVIVGSD
jgi:hypothetical protein